MAQKHIKRIPELTDAEKQRFWNKVDKNPDHPTGCWEWTSGLSSSGYGQFSVKRRTYGSHRISYFIETGKDPLDLLICHSCDNPKCVNHLHLFIGTVAENIADRDKKGRFGRTGGFHDPRHQMAHGCYFLKHPEMAAGERNGNSKITEENVREIRLRHSLGEAGSSISKRFGISTTHVWYIVKRKSWKHI